MRIEPTESENKDEGRFAKKCCITPGWLALTFLCMGTFLQGFVVNGMVNVTITPLQARFKVSQNGAKVTWKQYLLENTIIKLETNFHFETLLLIGNSFVKLEASI